MAVSSSVGSNIFDILAALFAFCWSLNSQEVLTSRSSADRSESSFTINCFEYFRSKVVDGREGVLRPGDVGTV